MRIVGSELAPRHGALSLLAVPQTLSLLAVSLSNPSNGSLSNPSKRLAIQTYNRLSLDFARGPDPFDPALHDDAALRPDQPSGLVRILELRPLSSYPLSRDSGSTDLSASANPQEEMKNE